MHTYYFLFSFQNFESVKNGTTLTVFQDNTEIRTTPYVRISGTDVRAKEAILICLALALLVFSISLFFKNWRKNYWDINQLPYYAYLYKVSITNYT